MKKILIFSIAYFPFIGGAEVAVKEITDRIGDFSFDMITLRFNGKWPKIEKIGNVNVYRIDCPKLFFPFKAFLKARKLNKENHYDLIWSIMANRAGFAAIFFRFFYPEKKFLLTLQEGDALDYPEKRMGWFYFFLKPFFRKIFLKADYIQVISNYLAQWAKNMGAKNDIEVVPNGVDISIFRNENNESKKEELKVNLGIKKDEKILITTSRLVEKNAIDDIIEALRYLPENIKFLILGSGPEEGKIKFKIKNLKLENRIIFLNHVEPWDVPSHLAISDIFVRPSRSEGLGNSFLEAMATGVPIIGTKVGGIPDFLKDRETGLFCEVNNPQSIAEKAMEYINNSELTDRIVKNAQKLVKENYNWNLISQKIKNIFNNLL